MLKNKKCIVFGGAGSIGSELVRQLTESENQVLIFDIDETRTYDLYEELSQRQYSIFYRIGDVRNKELVLNIFSEFKPELVFIASAYKHVSPSTIFPREYVDTNIGGTLNILEAAEKHPCKLVNISTDKVVGASSIMGATKKVAEIAVRDAGQVSVRFGNVLGSRGSVLEIWQRQIEKGEPLTVTSDKMTRYLMTIEEACDLVIKAVEIAEPGSVMVLDMGQKVNILQLAKDILNKSGKDVGIKTIGVRPGEALTEILMTPEEETQAKRVENFWVIENAKKENQKGFEKETNNI